MSTSPTTFYSSRQRMEAVWLERANRLSQRPVTAGSEQNTWPVIVLGIGDERYAIELRYLAEVLAHVSPSPVPGAAAIFAGVINVHGEIRPVIDLRRLLGFETAPKGHLARVVLMRKDGIEMGLQIDSVEQIRWIGSEQLQSGRNEDTGSSRYIQGATKDLLMLLSTEALFAELQTGVTS